MANLKIVTLLFIVTFALASCNIDQSVFDETRLQITDRAKDPTMSPSPGSFAQDSIQVTLSSATPDATILYTLDGTSPVNLQNFSNNVAVFWEAFGNNSACTQIYWELYDTVYDDVQGEHSGSWESELVLHVYYGRIAEETVQMCVDTLTVFSDPQYESLDHLLTAVDPQGVDACVEVFTLMNNTIITDINKWMDEIAEKDDEVLSSCLAVFELWNDTVGSDIQAMVYTGPIMLTQDTTIIAVAYRDDHLPSNPIEGRYVLTGAPNQPPVVALTSPSAGSEFVVGDTVSLVASASDADGSVVRVEFFANNVKVGERTSSPWSVSWSPQSEGSYSLTAKATDNEGAHATSSAVQVSVVIPPPENVPPTVALTSPQDGAVFQTDESIELRATASDSDGTVVKVEFFRNGQLVHTDTSAPYQYNQPALAVGSYTFSAKAYDNSGATAQSNTVNVRINARPQVSIIRPADGASYEEGQTVYAEANATDSDGTIAKVEFLLNGAIASTTYSAPYTAQFASLPAGTYELRARATDNDGATRTSAPVTFSVTAVQIPNQPPIVALTSPSAGSEYYIGDTVSLVASASDPDGSVVRVEFFANNVKVGERTSSPWSVSWSPQSAGSYSLTAKAHDNEGAQATSSAVQVSVYEPAPVNQLPTVAITSPQNGQVFYDNAAISASAEAHDSDGYVTKVEFLIDGAVVATATSAPYQVSLGVRQIGTYSLVARATDNQGATANSAPVEFHVMGYVEPIQPPTIPPPVIRFITPTLNELFTRFADALIKLEARDGDGQNVRVDLYAIYTHFASSKETLIQMGTLLEPPYDYELPKVKEGTYTFVGRASDRQGQSTEARVQIRVER
jgi:hypothetical protein